MSTVSTVKALLEADATLLATATGGVWDYDETGRLGLSRTTTPAAFDASERILPCLLVKMRSSQPTGELADGQSLSVRDHLEIWLYEDTGYAHIDTMRERVYALLQAVQLDGTHGCFWQGDVRGARDIELDASVERSDYTVIRMR
jgi:hypothetical protein